MDKVLRPYNKGRNKTVENKKVFFLATSIFLTLYFFSCNLNDSEHNILIAEKDAFLNGEIFNNKYIQDSLFKEFEGLWKCVRIINNQSQKEDYSESFSILLYDRKFWTLNYPCSWTSRYYVQDVFIRNDTIFFSQDDRVYIERNQIKWKGDTLVFKENGWRNLSYYYLKQPYDLKLLSDLKVYGFNSKCLKGRWELYSITDGGSDSWVVSDSILPHVPRIIDFSEDEFIIERKFLKSTKNSDIVFEIHQFDWSEKNGGDFFEIIDLQKHYGLYHYYDYKKIRL